MEYYTAKSTNHPGTTHFKEQRSNLNHNLIKLCYQP